MKGRFTTLDVRSVIPDIRQRCVGQRVMNVYDIDSKTYLIRMVKPDERLVLLIESGIRIHTTEFEWPKNAFPSNFAMKLRKHLRSRRLVKVEQLGIDRIIDLQFGSNEAAYHLIIELYDRGNIALTDFEYTILNLLRVRTDADQDVRFAVRERYPIEAAQQPDLLISEARLLQLLTNSKDGDSVKRLLNPHFIYGPTLIEHSLLQAGFPADAKVGKHVDVTADIRRILSALSQAEKFIQEAGTRIMKGYVVQKQQIKAQIGETTDTTEILIYEEFHPMLFSQHEAKPHIEFETFNQAVDNFFSEIGGQKLDMKQLQQEKSAIKRLDNIRKDHEKRLTDLREAQNTDAYRGQLIESNIELVDRAILSLRNLVANAVDWAEMGQVIKEAKSQGDEVALAIQKLKLEMNKFTMLLTVPLGGESDSDDVDTVDGVEVERKKSKKTVQGVVVEIDLGLSAYANARCFYDQKKYAAKKEQKTLEASGKAMKAAEKKTRQTLKEVAVTASIHKARKVFWFEKFLWFITSENYLVIGGRDSQQNELIVKRHLRAGDIYVHADLHGATSCIIKNPSGVPVPLKSLQEAGCMAICNSAAWDARIVTSAWWVYHDQVSKVAPTGEYLTTGAFMVRGKKNFLPPTQLVVGFGFLFRVDDSCIDKHLDERRSKIVDASEQQEADEGLTQENDEEEQIDLSDESDTESQLTAASLDIQLSTDPHFPDTSIDLQYVKGETFQLQRGISTLSTASASSSNQLMPEFDAVDADVDVGGEDGLAAAEDPTNSDIQIHQTKPRLSAKQRRELKKQKDKTEDEQSTSLPDHLPDLSSAAVKSTKNESSPPVSLLSKRGQKVNSPTSLCVMQCMQLVSRLQHKLKKMKEKYKDQDEEERLMRMEILASAGAAKEVKTKKGKKAKQQESRQMQKQQQRQIVGKQVNEAAVQASHEVGGDTTDGRDGREPFMSEGMVDITTAEHQQENATSTVDTQSDIVALSEHDQQQDESPADHDTLPTTHEHVLVKQEVEDEIDDENEQQEAADKDGMDYLNSLTGCPLEDDILLFAIPVCAPYSVLTNYKYKVKLTPGPGKRGKAARTALHTFIQDKTSLPRERDLLRSLKQVDLSRNIPGKVKLSAPNLQKQKKR
ncbi:ribosome quality control complex subunit NEMF-like isoform X2 [Corticium candelabrum]|uniref:ribosome quality control complex subunit NEMF-like isoform X2 n=1 Tax=Corticium candelabrum TaxID=121492 RepID=UPI002E269E71|nr:ribosome quality control complex subunit NEMF-like isoform X2 [Corticium candelabrum]